MCDALPLFATPRLGGAQLLGASRDVVINQQFTSRIQHHFVEFASAALIGYRKSAQPFDFVTPQLDAHWCIGGGVEHVEDGAALGELATMFGELLAHVSPFHECRGDGIKIERGTATNHDWLEGQCSRAEPLQ